MIKGEKKWKNEKKKKKLIVVFHPENMGYGDPVLHNNKCNNYYGGYPSRMIHVGGGVYCDDDGDNLDFR